MINAIENDPVNNNFFYYSIRKSQLKVSLLLFKTNYKQI